MPEYAHPIWRLTLADQDLTAHLEPRLIQLTLTDKRGMDADQLDLTLSDADGRLDIPTRGARLQLALGWSDTGLIEKGSFTVDEIEHSGAPDQLTIRARSADLREGLSAKKERSWHATTVAAIVQKIASEHALEPVISPELAARPVSHLDQTGESDANLLTRLAVLHGAIATVKAGRLLFGKIGSGKSASGHAFGVVRIDRRAGDRHRFSVTDRDACKSVKAYYYDAKSGKKAEVVLRLEAVQGAEKTRHSGQAAKVLRHTYATRANASRAAQSALNRASRGVATFSLSLARGRPELFPELPVSVSGFKPAINQEAWRIAGITHRLTPSSGLTSEVELELQGEEAAEEGEENAASE